MLLSNSQITTFFKRFFQHKWKIFFLSMLVTLIFSFIINFYYERVYRTEIKVGTAYKTGATRLFFSQEFIDINPRDFFYNNINIIINNKNFYNFCNSTSQNNCEKIILKNVIPKKIRSSIFHDSDNYNLEFVIKFYYTSSLENKEIFSNYVAHVFDNSFNKIFKDAYIFIKNQSEVNEKILQEIFISSINSNKIKEKRIQELHYKRAYDRLSSLKKNLFFINKNEKEKFYKIKKMSGKKLFFSNNIILLFGLFVFSSICFAIMFSNKK